MGLFSRLFGRKKPDATPEPVMADNTTPQEFDPAPAATPANPATPAAPPWKKPEPVAVPVPVEQEIEFTAAGEAEAITLTEATRLSDGDSISVEPSPADAFLDGTKSYVEEPGANLDDPSDTGTFGLTQAQIAQNEANTKAAASGDVVAVNTQPEVDHCATMNQTAREAEAAVVAMIDRNENERRAMQLLLDAATEQRDEARKYAEDLHLSIAPAGDVVSHDPCRCDELCQQATASFRRIIDLASN